MSESLADKPHSEVSASDAPVLLCELEPWGRVFWRNLGDLLLRREPPPVEITAQPVPVPPGNFIRTGIGPRRFAESYGYHIVLVAVVYLVCSLPMFRHSPQLQSPFNNTQITYYPVSEYLPPLDTGNKEPLPPRKGEPKLAKQEILSVPPQPDNNHQTIITPPKIKLTHDVALPNIVAWTPVPAAQPISASARSVAQLTVPQFTPDVVGPTADISQVKSPKALQLQPEVIGPSADVTKVKPKLELPNLAPSVVDPPLSADQLKLQHGQINMAQLQPQVQAPKLPVPPQRAAGVGQTAATNSGAATKTSAKAGAAAEPGPSPNVQNLGSTKGQGQIIALSLTPADVRGPVSGPEGNRSGEFHASPGGKADAPGTPNITGNGKEGGGGGHGGNGLPPGLVVGAPPAGATTSAVAGTPAKSPASPANAAQLEARKQMIAAAMKPSLPTISERQPPSPPPALPEDPERAIEQRVFGRKHYYSLIMNMPNLSSATGSWIIHFAELKESSETGKLAAPVATLQVDPAYPPDVLRDRVEGTVTLYAVIRADGSVADIRVLDSLDSRLDENAIRALSHWRFRPGTKNGEPVALEAVVQIPFKMHRLQ